MVEFTKNEIEFLQSLEEARLATCHDNMPHVKPVSFIFHKESIFIATDYNTKTFQNLKKNPKASVTIDIYKTGAHQAVCMQGDVVILEKGKEFDDIYQIFFKKFQWVRDDPWKE
ncbi:MAG: pyridoxamine 5'-phosphate oxidase family protein, partial [Nitrosopumilaceae archaeon]|nr:pyridoxamine 5'-phosphate oxidase family protein [Nitrosopumilaceae archaeon]NIP10599.1 pyridoxamine 5'-phosphate oxidase family protein [Nitrosopumilaceae archaeon]NIS94922.1 pyridoxamine 5'-phosphate oxidase family protein [Nitrosopumilaceae archaeon]